MDRWIFAFAVMGAIVIVSILAGPFLITQNQQLIVDKIDNNSATRTRQIEQQNIERDKQIQNETIERERLFQEAKIAILNNITDKLDSNNELIKELMIAHDLKNFTITLDENTTEQLRGPQGANGTQGETGEAGETGPIGPQGKTGERGERANP